MKSFYRFYRPLRFIMSHRARLETDIRGGICFKVQPQEMHDDKRVLLVSYGVCPWFEVFNRDIAKKIADRTHVWNVLANSVSTADVVTAMLEHDPGDLSDSPSGIYFAADLLYLKNELQRINRANFVAATQAQLHRDAVEALQLKKRYNELQS